MKVLAQVAELTVNVDSKPRLRVGFIGGRPMYCDDQVWVEPSLGRLIDLLRSRAGQFTLSLSASPTKPPLFTHSIDLQRESVLPLPKMLSTAEGFFKVSACRKIIRAVESRSDVVIIQLPFQAGFALTHPQRPRVYQICADVLAVASTSRHYRGVKRVAAVSVAWTLDAVQRRLVNRHDARHVSHGNSLWQRFGTERGVPVVSSTLLEREIMSVPRTRENDGVFRVLYVGYLRHEKGIDVLIEAFRQLTRRLPKIELHIVGPEGISDPQFADSVKKGLQHLVDEGKASLLGPRAFGPELFKCFANADVLVLPSRSEGTPRVLIEARAFGCPVIATNVGGIPTSVTADEDGLLVPHDDAESLCAAMYRLATDDSLRQCLREKGIERSKNTTIESLAETIWQQVLAVAPTQLQNHR